MLVLRCLLITWSTLLQLVHFKSCWVIFKQCKKISLQKNAKEWQISFLGQIKKQGIVGSLGKLINVKPKETQKKRTRTRVFYSNQTLKTKLIPSILKLPGVFAARFCSCMEIHPKSKLTSLCNLAKLRQLPLISSLDLTQFTLQKLFQSKQVYF